MANGNTETLMNYVFVLTSIVLRIPQFLSPPKKKNKIKPPRLSAFSPFIKNPSVLKV